MIIQLSRLMQWKIVECCSIVVRNVVVIMLHITCETGGVFEAPPYVGWRGKRDNSCIQIWDLNSCAGPCRAHRNLAQVVLRCVQQNIEGFPMFAVDNVDPRAGRNPLQQFVESLCVNVSGVCASCQVEDLYLVLQTSRAARQH